MGTRNNKVELLKDMQDERGEFKPLNIKTTTDKEANRFRMHCLNHKSIIPASEMIKHLDELLTLKLNPTNTSEIIKINLRPSSDFENIHLFGRRNLLMELADNNDKEGADYLISKMSAPAKLNAAIDIIKRVSSNKDYIRPENLKGIHDAMENLINGMSKSDKQEVLYALVDSSKQHLCLFKEYFISKVIEGGANPNKIRFVNISPLWPYPIIVPTTPAITAKVNGVGNYFNYIVREVKAKAHSHTI